MSKHLVKEGFAEKINHKRVERVMGKFDLHAKIGGKHLPKNYYLALKENPVELPGNVLARNFSAEGPLQKLVTDITYLPTDEGWTYTNPSYIKHLKNLESGQSMSRKGNCWDNACMENFFGLMKSETIR